MNEIIAKSPYNEEIRGLMYRLGAEFHALAGAPEKRLYVIRTALNEFQNRMQRRGVKGKGISMIQAALYITKRLNGAEMVHDGDDHDVSDHAFCAAIRRLGYDITKYKDIALSEAQEAELQAVWATGKGGRNRGRIVTFLPKVPA